MIAFALALTLQDTTHVPRDSVRAGGVLEPIVASIVIAPAAATRGKVEGGQIQELHQGTSLDEVLARIPGVVAENRGTFALDNRLVIRGAGARAAFGARGVTILLDGVPQTLPDGQAGLGQIDLESLESIQVVRGAAGAYYGNGAGGVLLLTSRDWAGTGTYADAHATYGAYGTSTIGGVARRKFGPPLSVDGLFVSASQTRQDGYRAYSAGTLRQASVTWTHGTDNRAMHARLRVSDLAQAENPGALDSAQLAANPRQALARNVAFGAGKQAVEWQGSLDAEGHALHGQASAVLYGVARSLDNPLASSWVKLNRADIGTRLAGQWGIGRSLNVLEAGLDVQRMADDRRNFANDSGRISGSATLDQTETVTSVGARLALARRVAYGWGGVAGVRLDEVLFRVADHYLADGDASAHRSMGAFSLVTSVDRTWKGWKASAGLSSAFESPTTTELARPGTGGFDPTLSPQQTLQAEAGLGYAFEALTFGATVYRSAVRDALVQREEPTMPGRFYYANAARVRLTGLELDGAWMVPTRSISRIQFSGALTIASHRYERFPTDSVAFDGHRVPGLPSLAAYVDASLMRRRGPMLDAEIVAQNRMYADDANSAFARGWTQANVRAGWAFGDRLHVFGGIRNVTDQRLVGSVNVNGALRRFFEPAPGRTWYVGLETSEYPR